MFCLEASSDHNYLFLGGNTPPNKHSSRGSAIISCVYFQKGLQPVSEQLLLDHNATAVTFIRRAETSPRDLIVGCLRSLFIIEFVNERFNKLLHIPQYHTGIITDIYLHDRCLLTVAKGDENVGVVMFDHEL